MLQCEACLKMFGRVFTANSFIYAALCRFVSSKESVFAVKDWGIRFFPKMPQPQNRIFKLNRENRDKRRIPG
ncbi:hypothetical protein HMPREF9370_2013 [Neisseria wadsworthii 9715]|uniref:Uncharacterized protein n=1 Tax=Neisseria wadsworthii 9715 TaxID=1030841 RepID=G4CSF3_9NEIS|nr:hypothetical protein HMPREF9370_2013 [Neisseria wadsworthii 9715]